MPPQIPPSLIHDRLSVQALHQAYADKTESFFSGLKRAPGDPCNVRIRAFGSVRTSIANGHDWLNRATFAGGESIEQIDEIIAYFAEQGQRCRIEWNPGNCYLPDTWDGELGRRLLARGFQPGGFRCVWVAETAVNAAGAGAPPIVLRRFGTNEIEEFLEVLATVEQQTDEQKAQSRLNVLYGEGGEDWQHYAGSIDGVPCCNATLFIGNGIGYLAWGQTLMAYRGRGCQTAMIRRRLMDARAAGCEIAFTVTDVGTPSARNLQREGFRLAYNYVMLTCDPLPIG